MVGMSGIGIMYMCGQAVAARAEEHQLYGGLGSAVSEVIVKNCLIPVEMIGMKDCYGGAGDAEELLKKYELKDKNIAKAVEKVLKRK